MKSPSINYLDLVPVRIIQEYTEEDGKITLLIPKFKSEWFRNWFIPERWSKYFRIHLDTMGSQVWRLIDGKTSTGELCNLVIGENTGDTNSEYQMELRVTKFLSKLYKNRFIKFANDKCV